MRLGRDWWRLVVAAVTSAQLRVLWALRQATRDGWPATVREVAGGLSVANTHRVLHQLEADGHAVHRGRKGWLPCADRLPESWPFPRVYDGKQWKLLVTESEYPPTPEVEV